MILFKIKNATKDDADIYNECLHSAEFRYNFGENINIGFINQLKKPNKKYILSIQKGENWQPFGFANFVLQERQQYFFSGGCLPTFFNSGKGFLACYNMVNYIFKKKIATDINTTVWKHNKRSLKMLRKIGFKITDDLGIQYVLKCKEISIDSDFYEWLQEKTSFIENT